MPKLIGIAVKLKKRAPMELLDTANITLSNGVQHDFRGKPGKRQITVLCRTAWLAACAEFGKEFMWEERRANLLVDEIELFQSAGKVIKIGPVKLLITGETDPCSRMNEIAPGFFDALLSHWRGGVCCQVLSEGQINNFDEVLLIDE